MPIGAFKLNSIAKAAAAPAGPSNENVFSLSNLTYNARAYQIPKMNYCGDDSTGRPVFFVGTRNSAGDFVASLIRRNADDTITESSVTTLKNTDERFEAQGAFGYDTSGNPVGVTVVCYRVSGVIKMDVYANQINLNALTLGTTYSSLVWNDAQPTAGFSYCTYLGNGRFGLGYRNTGIRTALASVGTSTITVGNELQESTYGDGVYQGIYGVTYQSDTKYRWISANGNGNQVGAAWFNNTTAAAGASTDNMTTGLGRTEVFEIDYDKFIGVSSVNSAAQRQAVSISWPASSGAPTLTAGSVTTFSNQSTWLGGFAGASDKTNNVLYVLHKDSSAGWQITPLTVSGTTISEGTKLAVSVTTTTWGNGAEANGACIAASSQGTLFAALIDDTGSNNPKVYFKKLN